MIPKKYTREKLIGRKAVLDRSIRNGAGNGISAGSYVTIVDVIRGKGLVIETERCPCCGQYAYISGVSRDEVTLIDETAGGADGQPKTGGWIPCSERLPEKKGPSDLPLSPLIKDKYYTEFDCGWNACLDAIMGTDNR